MRGLSARVTGYRCTGYCVRMWGSLWGPLVGHFPLTVALFGNSSGGSSREARIIPTLPGKVILLELAPLGVMHEGRKGTAA